MKTQIKSLVNKGLDESQIAKIVGKNRKFIRIFMLENDIIPAISKEKEYQELAKKLIEVKDQCMFYKEMTKKTDITLSKGLTICKMFDIEPTKVSKCVICGTTINAEKSTVARKYCSKKCSNIAFRKSTDKKPIIKECKVCGMTFEGSSNSKFCSEECKSFAKEVRGGIKCLKGL